MGTTAAGNVEGGRSRPLLGAVLLLAAAVIWGFAFVPQKHTVEVLPPLTATVVRFAIAAPVALVAALVAARRRGERLRFPAGPARLLGVVLFFAYLAQTAGLVYAPVARVALITGMYAVFVPLLAPLFGNPRPRPLHWLGAAVAFVGLLGLVGVGGEALAAPLNVGDLLVLLHALLGAVQVLLVSRLAHDVEPFTLNLMQVGAVGLLGLPVALVVDGPATLVAAVHLDGQSIAAFLYLAIISTVVAFTCQIFGQRHTSAPTAAVIMLMESPTALVAAVFILDENMRFGQWVGAAVLLAGVVISLVPELRRSSSGPPA